MNERIEKLAEQAELNATLLFNKEKLAKFAELIIKECEVALKPMLRDMISRGQAYDLIKKHFGLE